jgi:serine protease Do
MQDAAALKKRLRQL